MVVRTFGRNVFLVLFTVEVGCAGNVGEVAPAATGEETAVGVDAGSDVGTPDAGPADAPALESGGPALDSGPAETCVPKDPLVACRYPGCGDVSDGCGGTLRCADHCAEVKGYDTCGGGGVAGRCGCTPVTDVCNTTCAATNGCGEAVTCATCFGGCSIKAGDGVMCPTSQRQVLCPSGTPTGTACTLGGRDGAHDYWCCPA